MKQGIRTTEFWMVLVSSIANSMIASGVFPTASGSGPVSLSGPWDRIRRRAGLADLRIHDLRHSFASVGAGAGLGLPIIGRLLGHTQAATTSVASVLMRVVIFCLLPVAVLGG